MGNLARVAGSASRTVFVVADRVFSTRDVVDAAEFRGEVEPLRRRLSGAPTPGDPAGHDAATLQTLADEFRYQRDLITVEETERWLEARGLTLDDLSRHLSGRPSEEDLLAELWLSGEMDAMSRALAWRVVADRARGPDAPPGGEIEQERGRFLHRAGIDDAALSGWLSSRGRDESWLGDLARMEAVYRRSRDDLLDAVTLARTLHASRIPLTCLEVEILDLDTLDAASEALACMVEDEVTMEEVAREGGYPHERCQPILEDLPDDLQRLLLSATPGEVLGPVRAGPPHSLIRVLAKIEPDLGSPLVRERLEQRILTSHFSDLEARHVRWVIAPDGSA